MLTKSRMTFAEFLALPDEKPYREFINGEVVEKPMPTTEHGVLAFWVGQLWYALANKLGLTLEIGTEIRLLFNRESEAVRALLPDVAVTLLDPLTMMPLNRSDLPDIVIEIASPDDKLSRVIEKLKTYSDHGITAWLVEPKAQTVTLYRPGEHGIEFGVGGEIPAFPVAPGESIAVNALFAAPRRRSPAES